MLYLTQEGTYYYASMPQSGSDISIPECPGNIEEYTFNKENWTWNKTPISQEKVAVILRDLTVTEAEELYERAQNGDVTARLLIRWEDL